MFDRVLRRLLVVSKIYEFVYGHCLIGVSIFFFFFFHFSYCISLYILGLCNSFGRVSKTIIKHLQLNLIIFSTLFEIFFS